MIQAEFVLDKVPEGDTSIIMEDSEHIHAINSYAILVRRENVAVITRMRGNKAMYEIKKKALGEKENMAKNIT